MNLATYTLQVFGPQGVNKWLKPGHHEAQVKEMNKRVLANLPAMLETVEEDLTDMLPEGYKAKIEEAMT